MNAYGRKGREKKRLYTNASGKEKKKKRKKDQKKTTNTFGKERKTKAQMLVVNEKWLP